MGDPRHPAGQAALDEMGRLVAARLAALPTDPPPDDPPARRPAVPDRPLDPPPVGELEDLLASAEAGWADWRRRLADWRRAAGLL